MLRDGGARRVLACHTHDLTLVVLLAHRAHATGIRFGRDVRCVREGRSRTIRARDRCHPVEPIQLRDRFGLTRSVRFESRRSDEHRRKCLESASKTIVPRQVLAHPRHRDGSAPLDGCERLTVAIRIAHGLDEGRGAFIRNGIDVLGGRIGVAIRDPPDASTTGNSLFEHSPAAIERACPCVAIRVRVRELLAMAKIVRDVRAQRRRAVDLTVGVPTDRARRACDVEVVGVERARHDEAARTRFTRHQPKVIDIEGAHAGTGRSASGRARLWSAGRKDFASRAKYRVR